MLYVEPLSRLAINQPRGSGRYRYIVGTPKVSDYALDHALRTAEYPDMVEDILTTIAFTTGGGILTACAIVGGFGSADAHTTGGTVGLLLLTIFAGAIALFIYLLAYECAAGVYQESRIRRASGKGVTVVDIDDIRWRVLKDELNKDDRRVRIQEALTYRSDLTDLVKPPLDEYLIQTAGAAELLRHPEITSEDKAALGKRIAARAAHLHEVLATVFEKYDQPLLDAAARKAAEEEAIAAGEEARASFLREQSRRDVALDVQRVINELDSTS